MKELKARGFLSAAGSKVETLREVLAFFGVANLAAFDTVWVTPTAYRKSRVHDVKPTALAAWLRIGELAAKDAVVQPFNRKRLREIIPQLRSLTRLPIDGWRPQLQDLCASAGVVVVFVPEIPGSRICGVARWIDSDRALVQMSLRHKWADIFWFSFFHELAHVLFHDRKRLTFVDGPPKRGEDDDLEKEADDFAARTLIPPANAALLPALRTKDSVRSFADSIDVHPGIVVGRLQYDGQLKHNQFNDLRDRYTTADIAEGA
jgi:HTH-type transcriptional regulator/antitoxin HigA